MKPQHTWPIGDERWNKFYGGWGTKMKYLKTCKETFFGDVFESKPQNKLGPKSQSSAWRKGSRTCKPTEAKSTWRQEKQWKLFVVKARNLWIVTLTPPVPYKRCWNYSDMVVLAWLYRSQGYPRNSDNLQMLRSIFIIGQQRKDFGQKSL